MERFQQLAAVIAAHPDRQIVGRTRLQKEIKLLQRVGLGTGYSYSLHFYGPYSEELQGDIRIAERLGLLSERAEQAADGTQYYVFHATDATPVDASESVTRAIDSMVGASAVVLELAATYDAFREAGHDHQGALERLRLKKGAKCTSENLAAAFNVLRDLRLPVG